MSYQLRDFDWSQRLTLSSDKVSTLRRPVLLLKLDLVDDEGKQKEVVLELDEQELAQLVRDLGAANKVLNGLISEK